MFRKLTILAMLIMLLIPLAGVRADSMDDSVYCGDLSESDCQILLDSAAVMDEVSALAFGINLEMDFSGDATDDSLQLSGEAGGRMAMDLTAIEAMELADGEMDVDGISVLVEALLTAMSGDLWINLNGTSGSDEIALDITARVKDGVILFNASAMEDVMGQPMEGLEWFGLDTTGAIDGLLGEFGMPTADDMHTPDTSAMEMAESDATTVTRLPDSEVNGVAVAVFETSIDLNSFLSTVGLADILAAADMDGDVSSETMMQVMQNLDAEDLSSRQYIGLDDHYSYRTTVSMDVPVPGESMGEDNGDVRLYLAMEIDTWEFNVPVEVEIPEDAVVFPLAMLMQMNSQ